MKTCYLIFFLFFSSFIGVGDCNGQEDSNIPDCITITGVVVDESNEPIFNAVVFIVDSNKTLAGIVTDLDGKFSLNIPAYIVTETSARINVQYFGHLPESKQINELQNPGNIQFVLYPNPNQRIIKCYFTDYRVPLIDVYSGGHVKTMLDYEIEQGAY